MAATVKTVRPSSHSVQQALTRLRKEAKTVRLMDVSRAAIMKHVREAMDEADGA